MSEKRRLECECCAGQLVAKDKDTLVCLSCGTEYHDAAPDEELVALLNSACSKRKTADFDEALSEYEEILSRDGDCFDALWGAFLSEYGVEYVREGERYFPTLHRMTYRPAQSNGYCRKVLKALDGAERNEYKRRVEDIEKIRCEIEKLVKKNTEQYDVFICYKKTDGGSVTPETEWAKDLYYQLTGEGHKVFFAEKSLSSKVGEYEANIFFALQQSKVMLILASSVEHVTAPWVKNEWSRFLHLNEEQGGKYFKVIYEGLEPYDLPSPLRKEQAIDKRNIDWLDSVRAFIATSLKEEPSASSYSQKLDSQILQFSMLSKIGEDDKNLRDAMSVLQERAYQDALKEATVLMKKERFADASKLLLAYDKKEALRLSLLCDYHVFDEEGLSQLAIKLQENGLYLRLLPLLNEKERPIYESIARLCLINYDLNASIKEAWTYVNKGYFDDVAALAKSLLEKNPMHSEAWKLLLFAKLQSKDNLDLIKHRYWENVEYVNYIRFRGSADLGLESLKHSKLAAEEEEKKHNTTRLKQLLTELRHAEADKKRLIYARCAAWVFYLVAIPTYSLILSDAHRDVPTTTFFLFLWYFIGLSVSIAVYGKQKLFAALIPLPVLREIVVIKAHKQAVASYAPLKKLLETKRKEVAECKDKPQLKALATQSKSASAPTKKQASKVVNNDNDVFK